MENMREDSITKNTYSKYLISLFQDSELKNPEELTKISLQSFHYLAKNYFNLDSEMQVFADKLFDVCTERFDTVLKESPDTAEVRQAKRIIRAIKKEHPSASGLITSLESKQEIKEPVVIETRKLFEEYFQYFLDCLYDVTEDSHQGQASYAKLSMLFSIVDEMLAAFHMAQHGYVNQSYTHIRTVFEGINLIELFIRDESYAELWFSSDEKTKKKELKPVAVREKLGIKQDPLYAFLSAHGSHVTKEYVQSKSAKKREPSQEGNP